MIPLSLADVARLTGGRLVDGADPDQQVTGPVVMDSRRVEPSGLFVAVSGGETDGHDYAANAVAAGAVAALVERPVGVAGVVVDDVQLALAGLARGVLDVVRPRVVGVTGSSGKTSTKDLLATVFGAVGETVAPEASFNNELGLPLTVLRLSATTQTLICEYSARGVGHIRYLCGIARPDVSIVLNVGAAHLGEFGSRAAIAMAKGELVEALPRDGTAVLNADDPYVAQMRERTEAQVVTFGSHDDAAYRVMDVVVDDLARPSFRLVTPEGTSDVTLQIAGRHQALNAAAAVAAAHAAGIGVDVAVEAVQAATKVSPHRMQLRDRHDGLLVIDDAYNANPDSVRAALASLARVASGRGRSWAALGPMHELGAESDAMHEDVGRYVAELAIDQLVTVGDDARIIAAAAADVSGWKGTVRTVADYRAAAELLLAELAPDDVVLVKASNSERLWRLADALVASDVEVRA